MKKVLFFIFSFISMFTLFSSINVYAALIENPVTEINCVGYNVDIINAEYMNPYDVKTGSPVLDPSYLSSINLNKLTANMVYVDVRSSLNIDEMTTDMIDSYKTEFQVGGIYGVFLGSFETGFSSTRSFS